MKRCCHCRELLPIAQFCPRTRSADGYCPWCRECKRQRPSNGRAYRREYYARPEVRERVRQQVDTSTRYPAGAEQAGHKRCSGCLVLLPVAEFARGRRSPDGYGRTCRTCKALQPSADPQYRREQRVGERAERIRAQQRAWWAGNGERVNARRRAQRAVDAEAVNARERALYAANREARVAAQQARRDCDRETVNARQRGYYEANRENINARRRARAAERRG